jgi:CheY-like chemotaxis protein
MDAAITVTSQSIVAGDENVPAAMLAADLPKADAEPIVTIVSGKDGECSMLSGVLQRGMTYACVSVGDNGCGMSREVMEHIFEPFFTTKPVDRGTGLGLAAVHGIVAGHRGAMTVRSRKDEGTVFTLYFPQTAEEPEQKQGHTAKVVMGTGHVLVVDDQPDVATIACEMLARLGYMADSVSSADEAIDRLREKPDEYDMVLSDYSMPGMSGVDLASAIRADFPHMPVIIMTGYGRRKLEKEIKDNPSVVTMIRKPLDRVALSQVISKTLKRADSAAG